MLMQVEGHTLCLLGTQHLVTKLPARHAPAASTHLNKCRAAAGTETGSTDDAATALEQALAVSLMHELQSTWIQSPKVYLHS